MTTSASPVSLAALAGNPDEGFEALNRGLAMEAQLLNDLRAALVTQRGALAADDTAQLEDVVNQIGRTLLTIREARRQRGMLAELIVGAPNASLAAVADQVPAERGARFRERCRTLHDLAVVVSRELAINQAVIRRAIESGEHYLQHLLTVPADDYAARGADRPSGLILNQSA
jgi:flagellar FlgN protein